MPVTSCCSSLGALRRARLTQVLLDHEDRADDLGQDRRPDDRARRHDDEHVVGREVVQRRLGQLEVERRRGEQPGRASAVWRTRGGSACRAHGRGASARRRRTRSRTARSSRVPAPGSCRRCSRPTPPAGRRSRTRGTSPRRRPGRPACRGPCSRRAGRRPRPGRPRRRRRRCGCSARPNRRVVVLVRISPVMNQSSVTSWSSQIMYVGTLAITRRTLATSRRNSSSWRLSSKKFLDASANASRASAVVPYSGVMTASAASGVARPRDRIARGTSRRVVDVAFSIASPEPGRSWSCRRSGEDRPQQGVPGHAVHREVLTEADEVAGRRSLGRAGEARSGAAGTPARHQRC